MYTNAACQTSNTLMAPYRQEGRSARYTLPNLRFPSPLDTRLFDRDVESEHNLTTDRFSESEPLTSSEDEDHTYEFYFPRPPQNAYRQTESRRPDLESQSRQKSDMNGSLSRSRSRFNRQESKLSRKSKKDLDVVC